MHGPLMLAERMSADQRFADAQTWFHRIFNPTDRSSLPAPQKYWQTKPFYLTQDYQKSRIETVLAGVATGDVELTKAANLWLANPFQPDIVARFRTTAYQKAVVMKYLDNLIAWGDQLFRQETLESVNQATQLYILAAELLGRRPEEIPEKPPTPQSYRQIVGTTTAPAVVAVENLPLRPDERVRPNIAPGLGINWLQYFRIPRNDTLLGYWDIVADRLFKIRHGQNIDGVTEQLALFGPPIDPALLVRATAAGLDLAAVLDDLDAPSPHYRFGTMLAKAKELAAEVKSFGAALLSALEKRDAEALSRLHSAHELTVLRATRDVKYQQVQEAVQALEAVIRSRVIANDKWNYYNSRQPMNAKEKSHTDLAAEALRLQEVAAAIDLSVSVLALLPELKVGFPTTIGASFGGSNLGGALRALAGSLQSIAGIRNAAGSLAATVGGYDRRWDDWQFQKGQADLERRQYDSQIAAAIIRRDLALRELSNHDLQIANAQEADRFLYDKYTNRELYDWLVGQLSTAYFQAYQLAYDVAKRAERAFRRELGVEDTSYVRFGYWDSLHSGLMAGERLSADLGRLDAAYQDANARELELSKRISLAQLDPTALLQLKQTGRCYLTLPEALFDMDAPGHYFRRIKTMTVTVPCVAGPYTSVNLTATLLSSTVRVDPRLANGKYARQQGDGRFRDYAGPVESIVTSTGQEDSGLFEVNLHDERFLPFEGAGATRQWKLSLPDQMRQFDYDSISDVVLHVRYTARQGGDTLAAQAVTELRTALDNWAHGDGSTALYRVFSARREYGDQWARFLNPDAGQPATVRFRVDSGRFPYLFRDDRITAGAPELVLVLSTDQIPTGGKRYLDCYPGHELKPSLTVPDASRPADVTLTADPSLAGQPRGGADITDVSITAAGADWLVSVPAAQLEALPPELWDGTRLNPDAVADLLLVLRYTVDRVAP